MPTASVAVAKRPPPNEQALMHPPKRLRRPVIVLDEETYTSALSYIIARDFFPSLLESKAQQEFLLALGSGNDEWIDEAGERVKETMTPGTRRLPRNTLSPLHHTTTAAMTPLAWRGETPGGNEPARLASQKRESEATSEHLVPKTEADEQPDLSLSLSNFQARYTSEDNDSFNRVLDRHNVKKAAKYSWQRTANRLPSARQIAQAVRRQCLLDSADVQSEHDRARVGAPEASSAHEPVPDGSEDLDARPASVTQISQSQRNPLMFSKDQEDVTVTHSALPTVSEVAAVRSNAPPKTIAFERTRLGPEPVASLSYDDNGADGTSTGLDGSALESPSLSAIDSAIVDRARSRNHSIRQPDSMAHDNGMPSVDGYTFVDEEPTTAEVKAVSDARRKELERLTILNSIVEAHRSSGSEGFGNPFQFAKESRREELHHRMVEKTLAEKRQKTAQTRRPDSLNATPGKIVSGAGGSQTPRFLSGPSLNNDQRARLNAATPINSGTSKKSKGNLTPAARSLYNKVGRTPGRIMMSGESTPFDASRGRSDSSFKPSNIKAVRKDV